MQNIEASWTGQVALEKAAKNTDNRCFLLLFNVAHVVRYIKIGHFRSIFGLFCCRIYLAEPVRSS